MDKSHSSSHLARPAKRRRDFPRPDSASASGTDDGARGAEQQGSPTQTKVSDSTLWCRHGSDDLQEIRRPTHSSLTDEVKQVLHQLPPLASSALELLDLYLLLWECYVTHSACKIRLEEEHRQLQDSNAALSKSNKLLHQTSVDRELLLWDRHQVFDSVQRGILNVLQSSERQPCYVSELQ